MKTAFVRLLAVLASTFVAASEACTDGEFMSDPASCDNFYKCDHGQPVKFACAPGTWFNPDYNVCDWPRNVKCMVGQGGQGDAGQPGKGSGQTGGNAGNGGSKNGGNGGQNTKPSGNQGKPGSSGQDQGGSSQDDEEYLWPIQTPDDSAPQNNGGSSGQNSEDRPRPTIDDVYNANGNPYQPYIGNNRV